MPLAWVVRKERAVADDPNPNAADFGLAAGGYTAQFKADKKKVWDIISMLTLNLSCRDNIERHKRLCNGRAAFQALVCQFLGRLWRLLTATVR